MVGGRVSCQHAYQWDPRSEDFGICYLCGMEENREHAVRVTEKDEIIAAVKRNHELGYCSCGEIAEGDCECFGMNRLAYAQGLAPVLRRESPEETADRWFSAGDAEYERRANEVSPDEHGSGSGLRR